MSNSLILNVTCVKALVSRVALLGGGEPLGVGPSAEPLGFGGGEGRVPWGGIFKRSLSVKLESDPILCPCFPTPHVLLLPAPHHLPPSMGPSLAWVLLFRL